MVLLSTGGSNQVVRETLCLPNSVEERNVLLTVWPSVGT
jgi:hypothetical protein